MAMHPHSTATDGILLLESISLRLNALGVPLARPNENESLSKFKRLRADVLHRLISAEKAGIDVHPAFEIDEISISYAAHQLAKRWDESEGQLHESDLTWLSRRPKLTNRQPKKWFKKELLKRERQICDFLHTIRLQIGSRAMPVISDAVLESKQRQNKLAEKFAQEHQFETKVDDVVVSMPFLEAASSAKKRAAKLNVHAVGLEKYCTKIGLQGFFVTLTLPGNFHPNPKNGRNTWAGFTPLEAHDELQRLWRLFQREFGRQFGKVLGVRVEEPHEDGCPHWHLLIYTDIKNEEPLRKLIVHFFGGGPATKVVAVDPKEGKGSSYVMKYILLVIEAESDTLAARYQAHRATWGKRAIQFFDRPGSSTIWDQIRRIKPNSREFLELSSYARQMHDAACTNKFCEFLCLLDHNELKQSAISDVDKTSRNRKRVSIWRTTKAADIELSDGVPPCDMPPLQPTRILGVIDHGNCINTHPNDWTIERKGLAERLESQASVDEIWQSKNAITFGSKDRLATVMHSCPRIYALTECAQNKAPKTGLGGHQSVTRSEQLSGIQSFEVAMALSFGHQRRFSHSVHVHRSNPLAMGGEP